MSETIVPTRFDAGIRFYTEAIDDRTFLVHWTTGRHSRGGYRVVVERDIEDREIVAELAAMHDLLIEREVLAEGRTGRTVWISPSCGAIKKLAHRKSTKKHLYQYAYALTTRYAQAEIEVGRDFTWAKPLPDNKITDLVVNEPPAETISVQGIGEVCLHAHAIERLAERHNLEDIEKAWQTIHRMARQPFRPVQLPAHVALHKQARYSVVGETFRNTEGWHFVVVPERSRRVLKTIYMRF